MTMDLSKLKDPFPSNHIEWRIGRSGTSGKGPWAQVLAYLSARAIQDRLDEVCGPGNWKCEYREWHESKQGVAAQLCGISILIDNEWVTKWDGAESTDIEAVKGGLSSAFKRAGVAWGIGRYLYELGDSWAACSSEKRKDWNYAKTKDGTVFYWQPPELPAWAVPATSPSRPASQPQQQAPAPSPDPAPTQTEAKPQPAATGKPAKRDYDPWTKPDLSEYEAKIDDWKTVANHRRGHTDKSTGLWVADKELPLGEINVKTLRSWAVRWYLPDHPTEEDKMLRAALNVWKRHSESTNGEPVDEGIPF